MLSHLKRQQKTPKLRFQNKLPHDDTLYCTGLLHGTSIKIYWGCKQILNWFKFTLWELHASLRWSCLINQKCHNHGVCGTCLVDTQGEGLISFWDTFWDEGSSILGGFLGHFFLGRGTRGLSTLSSFLGRGTEACLFWEAPGGSSRDWAGCRC